MDYEENCEVCGAMNSVYVNFDMVVDDGWWDVELTDLKAEAFEEGRKAGVFEREWEEAREACFAYLSEYRFQTWFSSRTTEYWQEMRVRRCKVDYGKITKREEKALRKKYGSNWQFMYIFQR